MPVYKQPRSPHWLIEFVIDGQRLRRSSGTPIKRTAQTLERKWRQEIIEGKHQIKAPVRLTLNEAADRYYRTVIALKGSRKLSKDAEKYALGVIKRHFGSSTHLDQIAGETITAWKDTLLTDGKSPATINRYLATLRAILNRARAEWGALRFVPSFKLLSLDNARSIYLSEEEEQRLIPACAPHLRPLVICLIDTGLRLSEALDLTWGDICLADESHAYLTVRRAKNGSPRSIPLTIRCRRILKSLYPAHASETERVFTYRNGNKSEPVCFRHPHGAWKGALNRAEIKRDIHIHDLRHTFASRLVKAGVPIFDVSKLLGHKSLSMTMRYAHLSPASLQSAIGKLNPVPLELPTPEDCI